MASLVDKYFSQADFDAIEAAVKRAESGTSGEIAVELTSRSRSWMAERLTHALVFTLLCFLVALLLTRESGWVTYYKTTNALLWAGIGFVVAFFGWGAFLARKERRRRAVLAQAQGLLHRITSVAQRTGVMILVSLEERQAAVVADTGIALKVSQEFWEGVHARIVESIRRGKHSEGIIEAVGVIGAEMGKHFPRQDDDVNELPDRPRVVE